MQSSRTLFENGEMAVTLPTAALSGCGFGSLKCDTDKSTSKYLLEVIENDNNIGHLSWRGHLPTVETHLCFLKGGRRKTSGWEKKNRASKEEETSDNIQKGCNLLEHMSPDNACHLCCCVTWPAGAEKCTWDKLRKNWQLFLFKYKNSLWPLANNSLACPWNNSYCALGPTLAASIKLMCIFNSTSKRHAEQPHSFWKWGNGCDTSHSRASSPV